MTSNGEFDFGAGAPPRQPRKTAPVAPARPTAAAGPADGEGGEVAPSAVGTADAADAATRAQALANARRAVGAAAGIAAHVAGLDWQAIADELNAHGYAIVPGMLTADESAAMAAQYAQPRLFRSRVVMAQHGFGSGEYQYFRYPLPSMISALRQALYGPLAAIANRWHELLDIEARFPPDHADFLARCHAAGQNRPTPLLLQYGAGDYNCLHQDLYGEHVFPLQAAILLSEPGTDFDGGEFVLTEQRPRMQSRVEVVPLRRGDMVIFPVNHRPARGARGVYRVAMRHGVSRVRGVSGKALRHTLGIIFHDAA
ncbi:MAG TPA: 2OG-Fe(II) oxygenase [Duganella sp.]|uniref:2OG-Fe(II) oxygenase n=1 Tax=Duganella sp. TaxID=1904440 RepID=UPI002ED4385E